MHVLQWYQICHLLFQGMQNDSHCSGFLVDGLRILHSQYLELHRVVTHPLMIEYWGSNILDGRGIGTPIQLSQVNSDIFWMLADGSLPNSNASNDSDSDSSVEVYTCTPRNFRRLR